VSGRKTPIFAIGWSSPLLKVAVQVLLASMVTAPLAQPVPLQPAKVEPAAAVAIKVTRAPLLKVAEQVLPQLMPAGVLVTVPSPLPVLVTVFTTFTVRVGPVELKLEAKTD
jgi:hypothetical protein